MNQYITGTTIKELREQKQLTQAQLAERLGVSDKTVSKWETGKGYPDITLLEPLAQALSVSVSELISGDPVQNTNVSSNMMRSKFYVCPVCGNVMHSMGEAVVICHGALLKPAEVKPLDEAHCVSIEPVEDELFVHIDHEMTRQHHISFLAAVTSDRVQLVKLYPEGNAEARFKRNGLTKLYYYCNQDGLFCIDKVK